ncbi:hypothetical protein [Draconibacterium sp.]|uniref:hypothetical protein n=1 Tax=Draconibacterium sp. TaxID=1965318 RepID=UPI0035644A7F
MHFQGKRGENLFREAFFKENEVPTHFLMAFSRKKGRKTNSESFFQGKRGENLFREAFFKENEVPTHFLIAFSREKSKKMNFRPFLPKTTSGNIISFVRQQNIATVN